MSFLNLVHKYMFHVKRILAVSYETFELKSDVTASIGH